MNRLETVRSKDKSSNKYIFERSLTMTYSHEVEMMCPVSQGVNHGAAPIPEEAKWVQAKEIKDISGLTHGKGRCTHNFVFCYLVYAIVNAKTVTKFLHVKRHQHCKTLCKHCSHCFNLSYTNWKYGI